MEVQNKQKHKKRRTRKNLNEIRKRSRIEIKNNVNPSKLHIISKNNNVEQITSKRLTLALFNKTIRSETITRIPLIGGDNNINNNYNNTHNRKENTDTFPKFCNQYQNLNNTSSKSIVVHKKYDTTRSFKPQIEISSVNVDENNTPNSGILFSPLNKLRGESVSDISSEEYNFKQESLTLISDTSLEVESDNCGYEQFMNDLPKYLTEHFPAFSKGVMNKNIPYLRKCYLENCHQTLSQRPVTCIKNNLTINSPHGNYTDSIIQKPMEYILKGSSCQQNMKRQQNLINSSNSSSISQFGSNSNSAFVEDSPEYLYFPHKLNH